MTENGRHLPDVLTLTKEIRAVLRAARATAYRQVSHITALTNFEIGRRIVVHEQGGASRATYGKRILAASTRSSPPETAGRSPSFVSSTTAASTNVWPSLGTRTRWPRRARSWRSRRTSGRSPASWSSLAWRSVQDPGVEWIRRCQGQ